MYRRPTRLHDFTTNYYTMLTTTCSSILPNTNCQHLAPPAFRIVFCRFFHMI